MQEQNRGSVIMALLVVRNLGDQIYFEGYKNAATQGWRKTRETKETTEIVVSLYQEMVQI